MRRIILVVAIAAAIVLSAVVLMQWLWPNWIAFTGWSATQEPTPRLDPQWEAVQKWINAAGPRNSSASALRLQVVHPGIILPPDAETYPRAPSDLHILITRHGNDPARIEVRQGDHEWNVTENQLDQLPPDVRLHVQRPLGWVLEGPAAHAALSSLLPATPNAPTLPPPAYNNRIEKRLDELNARVEALVKAIEALGTD